jgi:hypothetical protein
LSFPPQTRSLYTLRPTARVLLQANFWKPQVRKAVVSVGLKVTMLLPAMTVRLLCESDTRNHQFYVYDCGYLTWTQRNRLFHAPDRCVALSTCIADWMR